MNDHALDAMIYAWLVMKEKEVTMEFINFGKVVNVSTSVPTAIDDATYHIIIDFVPDDPNIFDDFHDDMDEILKYPDNYVLCNVSDIVKVQDEILKLREQRIKEKQAFEDRIKELEGQLADAKKESDKKLCEAYMETNAVLYNSAYKFISFDKEFAEIKKDRDYWKARFGSVVEDFSKTLAANGVEFTVKAIDATSISCGTVPKCSSCAHYESGSRSRDVWCHKPVSKEGPGTIRRLCTEEAEGPACSDFKARKE